jgi:hypothetical protein
VEVVDMRYLAAVLAVVVLVACAAAGDPASSQVTVVPTDPPPTAPTTSTTLTPTTTTTVTPVAETPDLGDPAWIGREVELRLPPGGEGVEYGFDPGNMQVVVWADGEPTGLWVWGFHGYFGGDSYPVPESVVVVGEGPDVHRGQWEEEANPDFPLPPIEPIEPGTINDVAVWAVTRGDDLPGGTGATYVVWDVQAVRLLEDFGFALEVAYYRDWGWETDEPHPRLVGFADWQAEDRDDEDPIPARVVFEVVGDGDQLSLVVVDPAATHFGWPAP